MRTVSDPAAADFVLHADVQASWLADRSGRVVFASEAILPGSVVKDVCRFLGAK